MVKKKIVLFKANHQNYVDVIDFMG